MRPPWTEILATSTALVTLACAPVEPNTTPRADRRSTASTEAAPAPDARPGQRGRLRGGEPVERVVAWPEVAPENLGLDAEAERSIAASRVPVLAPRGPWSADLSVTTIGEAGYSLRARHLRSKLVLQGSRIARLHPEVVAAAGDRRIRGVDGFLTVNEGIRGASWIEGGVAYSADLECGDRRARECASDEGFVALLNALTYVGGDAQGRGGGR
ncbi:MAG: hypothetical protein R3B09_34740 [Nannocystaceae bacterium]